MSRKRTVLWPDTHIPDHDPRAVELALKIVADFKPHRLIFLGDMVSFDTISHWPKFRDEPTIAAERNQFNSVIRDIRSAVGPRCEFDFIEGNHEFRVRNYIYGSARELSSLDCLQLRNLLQFEKLGIRGPFDRITLCGDRFVVVHGWPIIRRWPGQAANEWLTREGRSGASGHTHTLAIVGRRRYDGFLTWAECGFLGNMQQHYLRGQQANWSHGLVIGVFGDTDFQTWECRFHNNYSWIAPWEKEYRA